MTPSTMQISASVSRMPMNSPKISEQPEAGSGLQLRAARDFPSRGIDPQQAAGSGWPELLAHVGLSETVRLFKASCKLRWLPR
jgi:hypothetical protein